jgi:hypothetical protein
MHAYLEGVACLIVPESNSAIITTTEQHIVLISAHSVHYRVVPSQVVQEHAISCLSYSVSMFTKQSHKHRRHIRLLRVVQSML